MNASAKDSSRRVVAIVGASPKPERYAHQAQTLLAHNGYTVVPVAPAAGEILGERVYRTLGDYAGPIDTATLYVGPDRLGPLVDGIIEAKPRRVIFNPGTESPEAKQRLEEAGIECEEACTLVLLRTGQF